MPFGQIFKTRMNQVRRFVMHNILHADDPPHDLALGIAIGVFVAFLPIFGAHMVLVVFLAWLLRANKLVGTPVVWLMNPATAIPIYYACYVLGVVLLGEENVGRAWWSQLAHPPANHWAAVSFYWEHLMKVAMPLTVGCTVVGLLFAVPTYVVSLHLIRRYRQRRAARLSVAEAE